MSDKVRINRSGATVLACESGNPSLGVMLTPDPAGLIVCLPTGEEPRHALDSVAVVLGPEQCEALAVIAARYPRDEARSLLSRLTLCPSCDNAATWVASERDEHNEPVDCCAFCGVRL